MGKQTNKMRKILTAILFMSIFSTANAGLLLEPYLGYAISGEGDMTEDGTSFKSEYSGLTYGGRVGWSSFGFMGGIDYSLSSYDVETKFNASTAKDGMDRSQMGIFVGFKFPVLLRVWGTYFISADMEGADAQAVSGAQVFDSRHKLEDGSGFGLGVGLSLMPFVSVNLEYRTIEYDKLSQAGVNVTTITEKMNMDEILLSVSLPIDLL